MPKEQTSRRVAGIAAKQLRKKSTSKANQSTAASALTQYEKKLKR